MRDSQRARPTLKFRLGVGEAAFEILDGEVMLGSSAGADLALPGEGVRERHARFELDGSVCLVTSLCEEDPVEVNGVKRREWMLRDGDLLRVGSVEVRFEWPEARSTADAAPAAPAPVAPAPVSSPIVPRPRSRREREAPEPVEEKRSFAQAMGVVLLASLVTMVLAVVFYLAVLKPDREPEPGDEGGTPGTSVEGGELDPFVEHAIRPLGERLDRPQFRLGARLVLLRCEYFLENHPDSPSAGVVRRIRGEAERYLDPSSPWSYEEMDFATKRLPTIGMPEGYFANEKRRILMSYLGTERDPARRFVAEQRLKGLD